MSIPHAPPGERRVVTDDRADGATRHGGNILVPEPSHADWLPPETARGLTAADVLARLRHVCPIVAAEAPETERQRRPTRRVWSAVRRSGLFYLTVPAEHGGIGVDTLDAFVEPVLELARHCMSTAWCAMQSLQHQWMIGLFPAAFRQEVFSSLPYVNCAGSSFPIGQARKVDGGYRLSGRYRWGSGILYSQWVFAIAAVDDPEGPGRRGCFFLPVEDVTVIDSWHVDGMVGSGSHDYVIDDAFVPAHRFLDATVLGAGQQDRNNPLQRAALPVVAPAIVPLPIVGAARAVVSAYRDRLIADPATRGANHVALARADTAVHIAELTIRDGIVRVQEHLQASRPVSAETRVFLRARSAFAVDLCRTAVRTIGDISGSSAHNLDNPMQRAIRDITMLSSHVVIDLGDALDAYGKGLAPVFAGSVPSA